MRSPERSRGRLRDIYHIHVRGQTLDVFGRPFQQQSVANAHNQIINLPSDVAIAPMNRKRIDTIPASQAHLTKPASNHFAIRRNKNFNRGGFHRANLIHPAQ